MLICVVSPFCGNAGCFDFVKLVLDGLFGSDLGIQRRLQLQTRRHVQLSKAPHLPRHVLTKRERPTTSKEHEEEDMRFILICCVRVSHRSSSSQACVPEPFKLLCHFCGQSLEVTTSVLLVAHPAQIS